MLSTQQSDGSFTTHFGADEMSDDDLAFAHGQALSALLQVYNFSQTHGSSNSLSLDDTARTPTVCHLSCFHLASVRLCATGSHASTGVAPVKCFLFTQ